MRPYSFSTCLAILIGLLFCVTLRQANATPLGGPEVKFVLSTSETYEWGSQANPSVHKVQLVRVGNITSSLSLTVTATNGTAIGSGTDFTFSNTAVSWAAGENTIKEVTVQLVNDNSDEGNETFTLNLTNVVGGNPISPITHTVTILNDDAPVVQFGTLSPTSIGEVAGSGYTTTLQLPFTISQPQNIPITVNYSVTGSATYGATNDYVLKDGANILNGSMTIPAYTTLKNIVIESINDALYESNETIVVTITSLSGRSGITINSLQNSRNATLISDESHVRLGALSATSVGEVAGSGYTTQITFPVTLTESRSTATTVTYTLGGTAAVTSDFVVKDGSTTLSGSFVIPANTTTKNFTIEALNDNIYEAPESIIITITGLVNSSSTLLIDSANSSRNATLISDESHVRLGALSATSLGEVAGSGYTTQITFPVTLTESRSTATTVTYSLTGGATASTDYVIKDGSTVLTGSFPIPANTTTKNFTIEALNDNIYEAPESIIITITGLVNSSSTLLIDSANSSRNATLISDESHVRLGALSATSLGEVAGSGYTTQITFPVTLTESRSTATTVTYTLGGTAAVTSDYVVKDGSTTLLASFTIPANTTSKTFTIDAINDNIYEVSETITITITGASGSSALLIDPANSSRSATLISDESHVRLGALSATSLGEVAGSGYTTQITFPVTLTESRSTATTVTYSLTGGATALTDYVIKDGSTVLTGSFPIPANTTTKNFTIESLNDNIYEAPQSIVITITGFVNSSSTLLIDSGNSSRNATLIDNEAIPTVALSPTSVGIYEGNSQNFVVTLSSPSEYTTLVDFTIEAHTATLSGNFIDFSYLPTNNILEFPPLVSTQIISLDVIDDNRFEDDETLSIDLINFSNAEPGSWTHADVVLKSDDDPSVLTINDVMVSENSGSATIQLQLDRPAGLSVTLNYSTSPDSAVSPSDFITQSGTTTFLEGEDTKSIEVPIVNESQNLLEPIETFNIIISNVMNATYDEGEHIVTINDDDSLFEIPLESVSIDNYTLLRLPGEIETGVSSDENLTYNWTIPTRTNSQSVILTDAEKPNNPVYADFSESGINGESIVQVDVTDTGNDGLSNSNTMVVSNKFWPYPEEFSPLISINGNDQETTGSIEVGWRLEKLSIVAGKQGPSYFYGKRSEASGSSQPTYEIHEKVDDQFRLVLSGEQLLGVGSYSDLDDVERQLLLTYDPVSDSVKSRIRDGRNGSWNVNPTNVYDNENGHVYNGQADVAWFNGWYVALSSSTDLDTKLFNLDSNGVTWSSVLTLPSGVGYPSFAESRNELLTLAATSSNNIYTWQLTRNFSNWNATSLSLSDNETPAALHHISDAFGNLWIARAYVGTNSKLIWNWFGAKFLSHGDPAELPNYLVYNTEDFVPVDLTGNLPSSFNLLSNPGAISADQGGYLYLLGTDEATGSLQIARVGEDVGAAWPSLVYDQTEAPIVPLTMRSIPGKSDSHGSIVFDQTGIAYLGWQASLFHDDSLYLIGRNYHNYLQIEEGAPYTLHSTFDLALGLSTISNNLEGNINAAAASTGSLSGIRSGENQYTVSDWIDASQLIENTLSVTASEAPSGWAFDEGQRGVSVTYRTSSGRLLWPARDLIVYTDEASALVKSLKIADNGEDGIPPLAPVTRDIRKDAGAYHQFDVLFEYEPPLPFNLGVQDVTWSVEGGVGVFESPGVFRASGLGAGTVHATLERQGVSDFAYMFVGQAGEVAYYEILPREETVVGLNERITFRAVAFDFGGNIVFNTKPYWELEGPGQLLQDGTYLSPSEESSTSVLVRVRDEQEPLAQGRKTLYIDSLAPQIANFSVNGLTSPEGATLVGDLVFHWDLQQIPQERSVPVVYTLLMNDQIQLGSTLTSEELTSSTLRIPVSSISLPFGEQEFKVIAVDARGNSNLLNAPSFRAVINNPGGNQDGNAGLDWLLAHQYRGTDERYVGSWKNQFERSSSELLMEASQATRVLSTCVLNYKAKDPLGKNVYDQQFHTVAQAYHDGIEWIVEEVENGSVDNFMSLAMAHEALASAPAIQDRVERIIGNTSSTYNRSSVLINAYINSFIDPTARNSASLNGVFEKGEESRATRLETLLALKVIHSANRQDVLAKLLNIKNSSGKKSVYEYFNRNVQLKLNGKNTLVWEPFENIAGWVNTPNRQQSLEQMEYGDADSLYLSAETGTLLLQQERQGISTELLELNDSSLVEFISAMNEGVNATGGYPEGAESAIDTAALTRFLVLHSLRSVENEIASKVNSSGGALINLAEIQNPHSEILTQPLTGSAYWLQAEKQITNTGSWNERAFDTATALEVLRPELLITQINYDYIEQGFTVEVANVGTIPATGIRVSLLEESAKNLVPQEIVSRRKAVSLAETVSVSENLGQSVRFFVSYQPPVYPPLITLVVNGERHFAEFDYNNNMREWKLPEGPNLRLQEGSLLASDNSLTGLPLIGQPWVLKARLFNVGRQPVVLRDPKNSGIVNPSRVKLYLGDPRVDLAATPVFTTSLADAFINSPHGRLLNQVLPGESVQLAIVVPSGVITTSGEQDLALWVDHASGFNGSIGDIRETDESDNIVDGTIEFFLTNNTRERPDLTIDPNTLSNNPNWVGCNDTTKLQLWVDNVGNAAAENVELELKVDDFGNIQSYTVPFIGAKRSQLIEIPVYGSLTSNNSRTLAITVDPKNKVDESDERNNSASYFMPIQCLEPAANLNAAIFSEDINASLKQGVYYPEAVIRNLGSTIDRKKLDIKFATRSYSTYRKPRGNFNTFGTFQFPIPGQALPLFSLPVGYASRLDASLLPGAAPLNPSWVDIEVTLLPDTQTPWDAISSDNRAVKSIFTGLSDLRIVSMTATPGVEMIVPECSEAISTFDIKVTVANGSGEPGLSRITPVHLVLRNERTGNVIGAINTIDLEPLKRLTGGETLGLKTYTFSNVSLPLSSQNYTSAGLPIPDSYRPHSIIADIDPFSIFADSNRSNNRAGLPLTVKPAAVNYTPVPPDFEIVEEDLRLSNENGQLIVSGTARYISSPNNEGCLPLNGEPALIYLTEENTDIALINSQDISVNYIAPGTEFPFILYTGVAAQNPLISTIDVVIKWNTSGQTEPNITNNRRSIPLLSPASPECNTVLSYASDVILYWNAPENSPVEVSSYLIRKFSKLRGSSETPQLEWIREVSSTTHDFLDQGLLTTRDYSYEIYSRGVNSRLSSTFCSLNVEPTSSRPEIAQVFDVEENTSHDVNTALNPDRIFLKGFEETRVIVHYDESLVNNPNQSLKLVLDKTEYPYQGTPTLITPSNPGESPYYEYTFILPEENTSIAQSSKLAVAYLEVKVNGLVAAKLYSNSVILVRDRMADLSFVYSEQTSSRYLELQVWKGYSWSPLPFHDLDVYLDKPFRIQTKIENIHNTELKLPNFNVLFEITYKDGTIDKRIIPVKGNELYNSQNGELLVSSSDYYIKSIYNFASPSYSPGQEPFQVKAGKELDKFRVFIDHDDTSNLGRVQEINESNNELIKPYFPSFKPAGTEFLLPLPQAYNWQRNTIISPINPIYWNNKGIDYRFMITSKAKESDTEPTIVKFYTTQEKFYGFYNIKPEEIEIGSTSINPGEKKEFILDPNFELATRPRVGTWWDFNTGIFYSRAIRIVGGREKDSDEKKPAEFSVTLFDPTDGEENTTLLIPVNQLNDNYTVMSYYTSRGRVAEQGHNKSVGWEQNLGIAYTVGQYIIITSPAETAQITITQNFMNVPTSNDFIGQRNPDGRSFTFTLKKGQSYIWSPFSWWSAHAPEREFEAAWQDPTGIQISATSPIVVASGINSGIPSFDSRLGDHTYSIMHPSGIRGTDFLVPPAPYDNPWTSSIGSEATGFFRVVPTVNDGTETKVWVNEKEEPIILGKGDFLEVTSINPFETSNYFAAKDPFARLLSEKEGDEYKYVKRVSILDNTYNQIKSDKPVMTTQYFVSSQNLTNIGCRQCHYYNYAGGDPEMLPILPRRAYSIDEYVSVSLPGEKFIDKNYNPNVNRKEDESSGYLSNQYYTLNSPTNFITLAISEERDSNGNLINNFNYNNPQIMYRRKGETAWRDVINDQDNLSVMRYPRRTQVSTSFYDSYRILPAPKWEELGWQTEGGFKSSGYRLLTLNVKTWNDDTRHFEFRNSQNLPMMVMTAGFAGKYSSTGEPQASSHGDTAVYRYVDLLPEVKISGVDLALNATSIRLPFSNEKIRAGETTPFLVEISNRGIADVASNDAVIQVLHVEKDDEGRITTSPILPSIIDMEGFPGDEQGLSGYSLLPTIAAEGYRVVGWLAGGTDNQAIYTDERFSFVPTENTIALRAYVAHKPRTEEVTSNNSSERLLQFQRPELLTQWVEYRRINESSPNGFTSNVLPKSQPALISGMGSNPKVTKDEVLTFVLHALSSELIEEPVKVRYSATTPNNSANVSGFIDVKFNSNDVKSVDGKQYYIASVPVSIKHQMGGRFKLTATTDADNIIVEDIEANNTAIYTYDVDFPRDGNMIVSNLRFYRDGVLATGPFYVNETVLAKADLRVSQGSIYNSEVNVISYLGNPETSSSVQLSEKQPTLISTDGNPVVVYPISMEVTFPSIYNGYYFLTANIDAVLPEYNYKDNKSGAIINVLSDNIRTLPDLAIRSGQVLPIPAYRSVTPDNWPLLRLSINKLNQPTVVDPFKVQVFLNSATDNQSQVIAEKIFQPSVPSVSSWLFEEQWDTSKVDLGKNTLTFVVDSPNHLAAVGLKGGITPSRSPLLAKQLQRNRGIELSGLTEDDHAAGVHVKVFAVNQELNYPENATLIGAWTVENGFTNEIFNSTTSTVEIQATEEPQPILLEFETISGNPFSIQDTALSLILRVEQPSSNNSSSTVELPVSLPINNRGGWKNRTAFWIATDGSTYFARQLHLANDYSGGAAIGYDPFDMLAETALSDVGGSVEESEEVQNNRKEVVLNVLPKLTDLQVSLTANPVNASSGELITFTADVTNNGTPNNSSFLVGLNVYSDENFSTTPIISLEQEIVSSIDYGTNHTLKFEWPTNSYSGNYYALVTVDDGIGNGLIPESDESNNTDTAAGVVSDELQLAISVSPTVVEAQNTTDFTMTVTSDLVSSGTLELLILDQVTGEVVLSNLLNEATINPINLLGTQSYTYNWNVGTTPAGTYVAEATLKRLVDRGYGNPISARSEQFIIQPDLNIAAAVSTNKKSYDCGEPIRINGWIESRSLNFDYGPILVKVSLQDSFGNTYPIGQTRLDYLLKNRREQINFSWNDPLLFSSQMSVILTAQEIEGTSTATATNTFTACASKEFVVEPDYGFVESGERIYTTSATNDLQSRLLGLNGNTDNLLLMVEENSTINSRDFRERNLFQNSGFEEPISAFFAPATGTSQVTPVCVAGEGIEGTAATKVVGKSGQFFETVSAPEAIKVNPGTSYVLSFYAKNDSSRSIQLTTNETSSDQITTSTIVGVFKLGTEWERYQIAYNTGSETEQLSFRFGLSGTTNSTYRFDQLQLEVGRVASSYVTGVDNAKRSPMLANPSLTLDESRLWKEIYPSLELDTDQQINSIPDGWRFVSLPATSSITIDSVLPTSLQRLGLVSSLTLNVISSPTILRQGLIPVVANANYTFSLYSRGSANLQERIIFYDSNKSIIGSPTVTNHVLASSAYNRFQTSITTPSTAAYLAVEIELASTQSETARLVAAQLEPGTTASLWKGWVPYFDRKETYPLSSSSEGIYQTHYQGLNISNKQSSLSSVPLFQDQDRDGRFEGIASETPSYSATAKTSNGTINSLPATDLFDQNIQSILLLDRQIVEASIEWRASIRPTIDQLEFRTSTLNPLQMSAKFEGRFEPGTWRTISETPIVNGLNRLTEVGTAYSQYRLTITKPLNSELVINDLKATGYIYDATDLLVYDTSAPICTVLNPNNGEKITNSLILELEAADNLSGVSEIIATLTDSESESIEEKIVNISKDGDFNLSFDTSKLSDGFATLVVSIRDHAGNQLMLPAIEVDLDRKAPLLTDPLTFNLTTNNHTWHKDLQNLQVRITTDETPSTTTLYQADLTAFGLSKEQPASSISQQNVFWLIPNAKTVRPDGVVSIPIWGSDEAGNTSERVFAQIRVDNTAPEIQIVTRLDSVLQEATVQLEGVAIDNPEGQIAIIQAFTDNGVPTNLLPSDSAFDQYTEYVSFEAGPFTDGTRCITLQATDAAGNVGIAEPYCIDVDAGGPVIEWVKITDTTINSTRFIRTGSNAQVDVLFGEDSFDPSTVNANLSDLGFSSYSIAELSEGSPREMKWLLESVLTHVDNGSILIPVEARDYLGRSTSAEGTILADNTPPELVSFAGPDTLTTSTTVTFIGTISDTAPGLLESVEYRLLESLSSPSPEGWKRLSGIPDMLTTETESLNFNLTLDSLSDQTYVFELRANDMAKWDLDVPGNIYRHIFTVDSLAPAPQLIVYKKSGADYQGSPRYIRNNDELRFVVLPNDATATTQTITLDLSNIHAGETTSYNEVTPDSYEDGAATWNDLAIQTNPTDGTTTFTVRVLDAAGLEGTAQTTVIADNTPPTIQTLELDNFVPLYRFRKAVLIGEAFDEAPGEMSVVQYRSAQLPNNSWQLAETSRLSNLAGFNATVLLPSDGTYNFEFRAVDMAGNIGQSRSIEVVLDTTNIPEISGAKLNDETIRSSVYTRDQHNVTMSLEITPKADDNITTASIMADFSEFGGSPTTYPSFISLPWAYFDLGQIDTNGFTGPVTATAWLVENPLEARSTDAIIVDNMAPVVSFNDASPIFASSPPEFIGAILSDHNLENSGPSRLDVRVNQQPHNSLFVDSEVVYSDEEVLLLSEWAFEVPVNQLLADGLYTYQIGGQDFVGNEVLTSPTLTLHIDSIPPIGTLQLDSSALTNQNTAEFSGTASELAGGSGVAKIEFNVNGSDTWTELSIPSLPALNVSFNFEASIQLEGENLVKFRATDRAGNVFVSAPVSVIRDTILPVMSIDTPTSFTWTNEPQIVSWSQVTNEVVSERNVLQHVTFEDIVTTRTVINDESITLDGRYELTVWATDLAGNVGLTDSTSFGIDTGLPTIQYNSLSSITGMASYSLSGIASDANQSGLATVSYSLDGRLPVLATTDSLAGNFTVDLSNLEEGLHSIAAFSTDVAGNDSLSTTHTLLVDLTPPQITIDSATQLDGLFHHRILGSISDSLTTPTLVQWSTPSTTWAATELNTLTGVYTFETDLKVGDNQFFVRGYDSVGNMNQAQRIFYLDDLSPVMSIDTPTTGTLHNSPIAVTWSALENDAATSESVLLHQPLTGDVATTRTLAWGESVSNEGLYFVEVTGADKYGNLSDPVNVEFGVDLTSPTITLSTVPPTNLSTVNFTGVGEDQLGSGVKSLSIRKGTSPWVNFENLLPESGMFYPQTVPYSTDLNFTHGENQPITVRSRDAAGNDSDPTTSTVSIDLISPEIVIQAPVQNEVLAGDAEGVLLSITDEFIGVNPNASISSIYWANRSESVNLSPVTGTQNFTGSLNTWRYGDGPATLQFRASDLLGNNSVNRPNSNNPISVGVMINNEYPPMAPTGLRLAYISYTQVEISWNKNTEDDLSHYLIYRRQNDGQPITVSNLLNPSAPQVYDTVGELRNAYIDVVATGVNDPANNPSYWDYAMKAVDLAGNQSLFSNQLSVVAPETPGNLLAIGRNGSVNLSWEPVTEGFVKGYRVYRRVSAVPAGTFSEVANVLGATASSMVDSSVTNGITYEYVVCAYDGAENLSVRSNIATATPSAGVSTIREKRFVIYESWSKFNTNDWDYEDVGTKMDAIIELDSNDNVTTIKLNMIGFYGGAGSIHNMYLDIVGLSGTANYDLKYWEPNVNPVGNTPFRQATGTYTWQGLKSNQGVLVFQDTLGSVTGERAGRGKFHNSTAQLTITINNPSSNPIENFDKIPFDLYIHNRSTGFWIYIYDPETGDHFDDNQIVPESFPELYGTYLNGAIVIPDFNFIPPNEKQPIWAAYPDFIDYARTYRSQEIRNRNWYTNND